MSDTIELLEAIGRDASLRHASTEEMINLLGQAEAPEALKAAVASGDPSRLSGGSTSHRTNPVAPPPGHIGHGCDDPDHDGDDDKPHHPPPPPPPPPEHGKS